MKRSIKVVPPKYGERTEYYALDLPDYAGPYASIAELERKLEAWPGGGEFTIVTKVKKVVVE